MARLFPGSDVGWAVTDLQSINHVLAWLRLGPGPRPPAELTRSQQPGRPSWNGADAQMVKRAVDRFMGQMPMLFSQKPFLQGSADLLRAPPLRQALHDVMPQLGITGKLGQPWPRPSLLCHFLGTERMIAT
jgi:hypothetical protein